MLIIVPLFQKLRKCHNCYNTAQALYAHRDIKPGNYFIEEDHVQLQLTKPRGLMETVLKTLYGTPSCAAVELISVDGSRCNVTGIECSNVSYTLGKLHLFVNRSKKYHATIFSDVSEDRMIILLVFLVCPLSVISRIHHLSIHNDRRQYIPLSTFGFYTGGEKSEVQRKISLNFCVGLDHNCFVTNLPQIQRTQN